MKALFVVSGFTTNQQIVRAVSQTLPLLTGGSIMATQSSLSGINKIIQARIDGNRGLSSGDGFFEDRYVWMKPFGSWARQNDHKGVAGYRMDARGLVVGIDTAISPALRLGLAFAYANVRIKNNRILAPQKLDIATHQLVAYGSYNLDHRTELNVQADIGLNRNKGNRAIEFTASQASSSYQSQVAHAGAGIGRSYPVGVGWSLSPSVRADYTWIRDSSYLETGAGALNLDVKSRSAKSLLMSTDSKISYHVSDTVTLTGHLGLGYDAFNERSSITATFAGEPGSSFITYGAPAVPWVTTAGLGMRYRTNEGMEITGRYDSEYRGGFSSQSASIKVRWSF
ncbi:hypothetical protein AY555_11305 (plasmid) [Haematospirillum jordaniae]|uniref:Autotransporter domain-containing protein n=2 Tax=Haematospirillum jordaniae TaxID=1549855 RepID=A0A145VSI3_9PROT|nr:hypothetical protein AY555_11305 [Haematospirillum jordaniae]